MTVKTTILVAAILVGSGLSAGAQGADGPASFAEWDADGDRLLTRAEMRASLLARIDAADSDGDGALSEAELTAWAQPQVAGRIARMIARRDASGDGLLQPDELWPPGREARLDAAFARADADEDGMLSAEEFAALRERVRRFVALRGGFGARHGGGGGAGFP